MFQKTAVIALLGMAAYAQSSLSSADKTFVTNAAQGGLAEVKLGELAKEKGSNQSVKDFGSHMVMDHSKANDELKGVASSKGVTVPDSITAKDQALYDRLSKLSGAAFDKAYISAMIKDHVTDVAEFQKESKSGKDSDVKGFAAKTLPTLQDHLKMARDAGSQVGVSD